MNKAHVQHPVGFIEHQNLGFAEAQRVASHQVEQATWSRNKDVDAVEQRPHLFPHPDATNRQRGS